MMTVTLPAEEADVVFTGFHFYRARGFRGFDDSPRAIFREGTLRRYADANHSVTKRGDAHFGAARR